MNTCIDPLVLSVTDVKRLLKNLNPIKAVGPDLVHNNIIKASFHVIAEALTLLFNRSFAEGHFPCIWKTAHITPIHKKWNKETCTNHRPISLLSCVWKVLEKCVQTRLQLPKYQLPFNSFSIRFHPGDSSVYQLLSFYDNICRSIDNGVTTQAIFFDISKAFDKVWHHGLVRPPLEAIGIGGGLLN